MANTSLPRAPDSPFSQAPTEVASTADPADDVNRPVPGWPTLARIISQRPDLEAFASFADLHIKSLLYYQAELIHLRKALHEVEWADYRKSDDEDDSSLFAENLGFLIEARDESIEQKKAPPQQWVLIEKIRVTLEKYNTALSQVSDLTALREADSGNVKSLKGCVKLAAKDHSTLAGVGASTWGDLSQMSPDQPSLPQLFWGLFTGFFTSPDSERKAPAGVFQEHLIVPSEEKKPDALTQWVAGSFIPFYDQLRKKKLVPFYNKYIIPPWNLLVILCCIPVSLWRLVFPIKCCKIDEEKRASDASSGSTLSHTTSNTSNATRVTDTTDTTDSSERSITNCITQYSGNWILRVTSLLTTVVACLLPVVAITVLAKVHKMSLILGLIAVFTAIFAIGLVLLSSSSSRVEIFTATAAFSAVMVVFVQNQIGPQ